MDQVWVQLLLQIGRLEELGRQQDGLSEDGSRSGDHNQPKRAGERLLNLDCSSGFDPIIFRFFSIPLTFSAKPLNNKNNHQIYLQGINLRHFHIKIHI